jgi:ferredoxin--NADP+ reductase
MNHVAPVTDAQPEVIPSNIYKLQAPWPAKVLSIHRLTDSASANDVQHIVLDLTGSDYRYIEGQSVGVLPPGNDPLTGKPYKLRLYSIASAAIGDNRQSNTLSICVKKAVTVDEKSGHTYTGVCSSYLCTLQVGDVVNITGPVGKAFVLPPLSQNPNLVMIATGTGIAPFRAFLDVAFQQKKLQTGDHWLFFGAQSRKDYLYGDTLEAYQQQYPQHFNLITAFSRESITVSGERMYVQHRLTEHADRLLKTLQAPNTYVYMCGLKGMEQGVIQGLQQAADTMGVDWSTLHQQLIDEKRWHIEVY